MGDCHCLYHDVTLSTVLITQDNPEGEDRKATDTAWNLISWLKPPCPSVSFFLYDESIVYLVSDVAGSQFLYGKTLLGIYSDRRILKIEHFLWERRQIWDINYHGEYLYLSFTGNFYLIVRARRSSQLDSHTVVCSPLWQHLYTFNTVITWWVVHCNSIVHLYTFNTVITWAVHQ